MRPLAALAAPPALAALICTAALVWPAPGAQAQPAPTAPGSSSAPAGADKGAPGTPGPGGVAGAAGALHGGSGPGYHSPQSTFAPLPQRNDVVPWSQLSSLKKKTLRDRIQPIFNADQKALDGKRQRVQGFMVPMDTKGTQTHFLLTSVPLTCAFCIPGGPESMIEVKTRKGVRYSLEPVVVEGRFELLHDDPYGLFYRLVEAVPVP